MKKEIDINTLIKLYQAQTPVEQICLQCGISKQTVYNLLKRENVALNRQKLHENCGCPLFKRDLYHMIYCEDFGEWEFLSLSFKDAAAKNRHKKMYCSGNGYTECSIFKLLEE